ncbi:T9SS type A sorting domain-containing protein [Nonlabens mediterrranea]|uniref:T9SS type A sorting domain-containing protein n=1 Tax=Nonlabens mediterrranea TaxID=1419947 RepID=A0ABS0A3H3_9FLAO|nr:T9SS type A sorting domain-containing protein [Nonlabens mediterrranea]
MRFITFLFLLGFISTIAQPGLDNPWMEQLREQKSEHEITYQDIKNAGEAYWELHDKNAKGSGYKPFMRWVDAAKSYVKEDGTIQGAEDLERILNERNFRKSSLSDNSNWSAIGPFSIQGTGSWSTGTGRVNTVTIDPNNPNTYYLGSPSGGIWKSIDAGTTWIPISDFLSQIGVSAIAVDPADSNIIYIGTGDDDARDSSSIGLMKSIDGGQTWNSTGLTFIGATANISEIYLDPRDSNKVFVSSNFGFYRSIDGGVSFSRTFPANVKDIKLKPGSPDTIYLSTNNAFFISTDNGVTFTQPSTGLPGTMRRSVIAVSPANPNYVYLLIIDGNANLMGLYRSTNSGQNFARRDNGTDILESGQGNFDLALEVSETNAEIVYTGCLNIWKSFNGGSSFSKINSWNNPSGSTYTHADIHQIRQFGTELFVMSDGGVYRSNNDAGSFTDLTAGAQIGQFYRIAVSAQSSAQVIGGLQDNGGQARSGNQWKNFYGADGMDGGINPLDSNIRYGFIQNGGGLYFTNNGGNSILNTIFRPNGENGNWITPLKTDSQGTIYVGYTALYKVQNNNFIAVSPSFTSNIDVIEIDPTDDNIIYIAVDNILYRSNNAGVSFGVVSNFTLDIAAIEVSNTDNNIIYVSTEESYGSVYKSINQGITFTDITANLPDLGKNTIASLPMSVDGEIYLGTTIGVYKYDDVSTQWTVFNNNLPNVNVRDLEINGIDNILTAGTYGRGIWQTSFSAAPPPTDIQLVRISSSDTNFSCGVDEVDVIIKNGGSTDINNFNIDYSLNGGSIVSTNYSSLITAQSETTVTLTGLPLNLGPNDLSVTINTTNDAFSSNNDDTATVLKNNSGIINDIHQFENRDFLTFNETGGTNEWQRGVPSGPILNQAASGTQVYATNLSGLHSNNTVAYLYTGCYNLNGVINPSLQFEMAFELEQDYDILYIEYTTDSGDNWSILGSATDQNWYNSNRNPNGIDCTNCVGAQWTGMDTVMSTYTYDLNAFNAENNISFRFVFISDSGVREEGVVLDNVVVTGTLSNDSNTLSESYKIYPNPSNGNFTLSWNSNESFDYHIYDVTGKLITTRLNNSGDNHSININNVAQGMYFLNISTSMGTVTEKLIIK